MLPSKYWVYWERSGAGEGVKPVGSRVKAAGDETGLALTALAKTVFENDTHRYRITMRITNNARKEMICRIIIIVFTFF